MSETFLRGRKILAVEDEMLVAMMLQDILEDAGCTVVSAGHLKQALHLAQSMDIDGAVLDENLNGERSYPVADTLIARGIPFVFATGYGEADLGKLYPGRRILAKPYLETDLLAALSAAISTPPDVR